MTNGSTRETSMPSAAQRGEHHRRARPVGAVGDLQRHRAAVGQGRGEHTSAPSLAINPGTSRMKW